MIDKDFSKVIKNIHSNLTKPMKRKKNKNTQGYKTVVDEKSPMCR